MAKYLDKYPHCIGCPVAKYCGTMCISVHLCNSYKDPSFDTEEDAIRDTLTKKKEYETHSYSCT